jgi:hypothetical protein
VAPLLFVIRHALAAANDAHLAAFRHREPAWQQARCVGINGASGSASFGSREQGMSAGGWVAGGPRDWWEGWPQQGGP